MTDSITSVVEYHERTKHRLDGYAKGPDTIDWDAQPNPFRMFKGAPLVRLPLQADQHEVLYSDLYQPENICKQPLNLNNISIMLEVSIALSAWKQYGTARWSLRCNPSSGNLHPTETYLVLLGVEGIDDGIYHYRADQHGLEQRCAIENQATEDPMALIGFTSVHWREAWKYGERAFRYCQHDVGHASAAVSYGASIQGWSVTPVTRAGDEQIASLFGIDRNDDFQMAEREHPDQIFVLSNDKDASKSVISKLPALISTVKEATWQGGANRLDRRHFYKWPIIDEVSEIATKPIQNESVENNPAESFYNESSPLTIECNETAAKLFRMRRSAQGFDGQTEMKKGDFFILLDHLQARSSLAPWNTLSSSPSVHLVFFIHRVEGLKPGLYALPRSPSGLDLMKTEMRDEFTWNAVEDTPPSAPLYELVLARAEKAATQVSCHQPIAGQSCFSLAMLAEFDSNVDQSPWRYRELFWETGVIGQVLYLEAEAFHLRGTGIGCFFDDAVHSLLGITGRKLQSLYHFTVGGPLVDQRIASLPPYSHLSA